jgi:hypothetical protein
MERLLRSVDDHDGGGTASAAPTGGRLPEPRSGGFLASWDAMTDTALAYTPRGFTVLGHPSPTTDTKDFCDDRLPHA